MDITRRIGTSPDFGTVEITGDISADLLSAVEQEHGSSDKRSCDICQAASQGFGYVAAYLLFGATETPLLDAVIKHYAVDFSGDKFPEWAEWVEHHDKYGRECDACGAYTFASDGYEPTDCGNCGTGLMEESDSLENLQRFVQDDLDPNAVVQPRMLEASQSFPGFSYEDVGVWGRNNPQARGFEPANDVERRYIEEGGDVSDIEVDCNG